MSDQSLSFSTGDEFMRCFRSLPGDQRVIWAQSLTEEQVKTPYKNGWTVAHTLANLGLLPARCITKSVLELTDNNGLSVAKNIMDSFFTPDPPGKYTWKYLSPDLLNPDTAWGYVNLMRVAEWVRGGIRRNFDGNFDISPKVRNFISGVPFQSIAIVLENMESVSIKGILQNEIGERIREMENDPEIFKSANPDPDSGAEDLYSAGPYRL